MKRLLAILAGIAAAITVAFAARGMRRQDALAGAAEQDANHLERNAATIKGSAELAEVQRRRAAVHRANGALIKEQAKGRIASVRDVVGDEDAARLADRLNRAL